MKVNDFKTDLEWSEAQHTQDWWLPYYKVAFPDMVRIEGVSGPSPEQRAGIDKIVVLSSGKRLSVDEKVRRLRAPSDILLEVKHVPVNGEPEWPGWMDKPNQLTDYLAVGFSAYRTAFFFPFVSLRTAWKRNKEEWLNRFTVPPALNPNARPPYNTHNVAIPTEVLMESICDAIEVKLDDDGYFINEDNRSVNGVIDFDDAEWERFMETWPTGARVKPRHHGGTPDEWETVADQVIAGRFDDADGSMRKALVIGFKAVGTARCLAAEKRIAGHEKSNDGDAVRVTKVTSGRGKGAKPRAAQAMLKGEV
jgi:hypothetical protein